MLVSCRSVDGITNCMWGVRVASSQDILVTRFDMQSRCSMDIAVMVGARSGSASAMRRGLGMHFP